VKTISKEFRSW